jgi:adenylate cyclase
MFARYTSDSIVDQVLQANKVVLAGERREVTVLFVDVRGFTRFAEQNEPELVMATLNEVLGRLADAVLAHGGHVDKFLGDGLMAVFGAPVHQPDHVERGVRAGLLMLEAIRDRDLKTKPELRLAVGIGLNSGPVIVGSIGNERRTEYTCIGDTVNVASRLCGLAGEGELLLGQATAEHAGAATRVEELPPVQLKGKSQALPVFRVVSLT